MANKGGNAIWVLHCSSSISVVRYSGLRFTGVLACHRNLGMGYSHNETSTPPFGHVRPSPVDVPLLPPQHL